MVGDVQKVYQERDHKMVWDENSNEIDLQCEILFN